MPVGRGGGRGPASTTAPVSPAPVEDLAPTADATTGELAPAPVVELASAQSEGQTVTEQVLAAATVTGDVVTRRVAHSRGFTPL